MNTSTQSTLVREINIPIPWENGLPHSETDEWCSLGLHLKCGKLHLQLTVELMIYTAVLYFTDFIKHVFKINGDIQPDRERDTHSRECVRGFQVASFPPAREARRSNGDISVNLSLSGVVSFSKRRKSLAWWGEARPANASSEWHLSVARCLGTRSAVSILRAQPSTRTRLDTLLRPCDQTGTMSKDNCIYF